MKAMILSAGLGTRLKPLTNKIPKALTTINNKPLIEYVILRLLQYGVNEIIINVHHHAQQIIDYLKNKNNFNIRIEIAHEALLLNTGGGLKNAAWFFNDSNPFILHNVDVISNVDFHDMLIHHKKNKAAVTLAVRTRNTSRFLIFDEQDQLLGWKNIKNREIIKSPMEFYFSFMGIHIISPEIFLDMPDKNIFSIIDLYVNMAKKERIIKAFHADQYFWFDLGNQDNIKEAKKYLSAIKYMI